MRLKDGTIFVTGGAGFIGSAVCRLFVGELNVTIFGMSIS